MRRLVLAPLGMTRSSFPTEWPDEDAVTGYRLTGDGRFGAMPPQVSTVPAAAGPWTTATDLVRFAVRHASPLPAELSAQAVAPQAAQRIPGRRCRPRLADQRAQARLRAPGGRVIADRLRSTAA